MKLFVKDIGIDLGTANTLVHLKGRGIVLREPSVVAVDKKSSTVLAVGNQAKEMLGRTPENIMAVRPLKDGVIADFRSTQMMLKYFINKIAKRYVFGKPRVVICVPSGVTDVEERAVVEAATSSGAKEAYLMEEPMAAAIGAGLQVAEPTGCMIVDIGGGTSEVAVISLGGIVTCKSLRVAGDKLDESIVNYIKKAYNLLIGDRTAEEIKLEIGTAYKSMTEERMEVKGRDLLTGLPKTITITSSQIEEAMKESINSILDTIKLTLEKTPPELAADIMERGIMLAGGGALIKNLDRYISEETGIPVHIAERPLDCVALGAGKTLENIEVYKKVLKTSRR